MSKVEQLLTDILAELKDINAELKDSNPRHRTELDMKVRKAKQAEADQGTLQIIDKMLTKVQEAKESGQEAPLEEFVIQTNHERWKLITGKEWPNR